MAELNILSNTTPLLPGEALRHRAPAYDDEGRPLSDFMMLIPKLSQRPQHQIKQTLQHLQDVINRYQEHIVFVDLNLRINVLWVSVKPVPGICLELPTAIKACIPEALLVAQPPHQQ